MSVKCPICNGQMSNGTCGVCGYDVSFDCVKHPTAVSNIKNNLLAIEKCREQASNDPKVVFAQTDKMLAAAIERLEQSANSKNPDIGMIVSSIKEARSELRQLSGDKPKADDYGSTEIISAAATQHYSRAMQLWKEAAERGDKKAEESLSANYAYNIECKYKKAVPYADSMLANARSYHISKESEQLSRKSEKEFAQLMKAAALGSRHAAKILGDVISHGLAENHHQDYRTAMLWYRRAAQMGDMTAYYELGRFYEYGLDVVQDLAEATAYYSIAADEGCWSACERLGLYYENESCPAYPERAVGYYRKAAEGGDMNCRYHLGRCYQYAIGVGRDLSESEKWYSLAAGQGHELAQQALEDVRLLNKVQRFPGAEKLIGLAKTVNSYGSDYIQRGARSIEERKNKAKKKREELEAERRAEEEHSRAEEDRDKRIKSYPRIARAEKLGTMIAAGMYHTVGLKANGTVAAVGSNGDYQCNVERWNNIIAIAAGNDHTVGLRADGTVTAVGSNREGKSRSVCLWTDITAVSAGWAHTVGLKADNTVVAVGRNEDGQCNVGGWTNIVSIAAGGRHTVGLKDDGNVVAVGYNGDGQRDVRRWSDIGAIAAGDSHTVGLKPNGTVVAAGNNRYHQCKVDDWTQIIAIAAGDKHTVGLRTDGTVVAVGYNGNGQCNTSGWTDIVAIAAGDSHTVGLKSDGTLVAVGYNRYGQCNVDSWKLFDSIDTCDAERKTAAHLLHEEKRTKLNGEKAKLEAELSKLQGIYNAGKRQEIKARIADIQKMIDSLEN